MKSFRRIKRKNRKTKNFNRKNNKSRKTGGSNLRNSIYEVSSKFIKDTYDTDSKLGTEILIKSKSDNKYYKKYPPFRVNTISPQPFIYGVDDEHIEINDKGEFNYYINDKSSIYTYEVFNSYRSSNTFGKKNMYYVKIEQVKRNDTLEVVSSESFYPPQPKDELEKKLYVYVPMSDEILIEHDNIYYKQKDEPGLEPISVGKGSGLNYIYINKKRQGIKIYDEFFFNYNINENNEEVKCRYYDYSKFYKYSMGGKIYYSKNKIKVTTSDSNSENI